MTKQSDWERQRDRDEMLCVIAKGVEMLLSRAANIEHNASSYDMARHTGHMIVMRQRIEGWYKK